LLAAVVAALVWAEPVWASEAKGPPGGRAVGQLTLDSPDLWLNGTLVQAPKDVFSRSIVRSSGDGTGLLTLTLKHTICSIDISSRVQVQPTRNVLFQSLVGEVRCTMKSKSKKNVVVYRGPGQSIVARDPTFSLGVRGGRTTVKVLSGAVTVKGSSGSRGSVTVTANQQTVISRGGDPQPASPLLLTERERDGFNALAAAPSPWAQLLLGVTGNPARFRAETGQTSKVVMAFLGWGQGMSYGAPFQALLPTLGPVPMLHLGTLGRGNKAEAITPGSIAAGRGDAYLLALNQAIAAWGKAIYVRPMAEMNNRGNPWAGYGSSGQPRDAAHAPSTYRKAFARIYLVVHGGPVAAINAKLAALGMPLVSGGDLPANPFPRVRVVWSPLATGAPRPEGNAAESYYPGDGYADVVGGDIFAEPTGAPWDGLAKLAALAAAHDKPFSIPEWGLLGGDDPDFVTKMCAFLASHPATETAEFFDGRPGSTLSLQSKPRSRAAYRACITPLGGPLPSWASAAAGIPEEIALGLTASPTAGAPPLDVTFAVRAKLTVEIARWQLLFGDGTETGGSGSPPETVQHRYLGDGDYGATLLVYAGPPFRITAARFLAQTNVAVGTAKAVLDFVPTPTSGKAKLKVSFRVDLNAPGDVTSWQLVLGDGNVREGSGRPPHFVGHTYAKPGSYRAILVVSASSSGGAGRFVAYADLTVT
jgi:hypothetical protein